MTRANTVEQKQEFLKVQAENERLKADNELLTLQLGALKDNLYYRLNEKNKAKIDEIIFNTVTGQIDKRTQAK